MSTIRIQISNIHADAIGAYLTELGRSWRIVERTGDHVEDVATCETDASRDEVQSATDRSVEVRGDRCSAIEWLPPGPPEHVLREERDAMIRSLPEREAIAFARWCAERALRAARPLGFVAQQLARHAAAEVRSAEQHGPTSVGTVHDRCVSAASAAVDATCAAPAYAREMARMPELRAQLEHLRRPAPRRIGDVGEVRCGDLMGPHDGVRLCGTCSTTSHEERTIPCGALIERLRDLAEIEPPPGWEQRAEDRAREQGAL